MADIIGLKAIQILELIIKNQTILCGVGFWWRKLLFSLLICRFNCLKLLQNLVLPSLAKFKKHLFSTV